MSGLRIFAGNSNLELAKEVTDYLDVSLGEALVSTFSDGETRVEIREDLHGKDVFIIQSTCPPVNQNLMELLIIVDALKRSSAKEITAVIPYYGYARQDRRNLSGEPITARLVADLITTAGANHILAVDLHVGQIEGFFNIPVDHLGAAPIFLDYIRENIGSDIVIVSPDAGGVKRARGFASKLGANLALIDKRRDAPNLAYAMNIVGDVSGKAAIILDDMVDTAGTLVEASYMLSDNGATKIYGCCTHAVLSGPAIKRIIDSPIEKLIVTNTIPLKEEAKNCNKIEVLSVAPILGEAIKYICKGNADE